ncbi:hypothetical protein MUCCIDRAFT_114943 [Mucor lusitanicus CBS 277.49]|uniref:Uncharacterized protein n=1 Tax=Mucor lusitanicus CBS 277.49 TaxID=747725 RepID=A0A168HEL1_MUCCL|nr:hypothetical protein MUCCIDRAFT_114943 [Mucor lusitanicus CBS 277.49]
MSTPVPNNPKKAVDPAHPTNEPFTSPAALGGLIDQIMRKTSRIFHGSDDNDTKNNNKA